MDDAGEAAKETPQGTVAGRSAGRRERPPAAELFAAVVELISTGAAAFKGTARRYSLCAADADDAYQRGLEILMTKGPTASRSELRPWLHTVIKHEALALRRQRERLLAGGADAPGDRVLGESSSGPDEGAAERERARQTAEALGELKSSEIQCLLLKALGYSYNEISTRTGFSWTKVNRSLTEGRKRFFARFDQIESGERCERFAPLLSAASDGEASADDERRLRAHLRGCHTCRAVLRGYRGVPARLAQLLPPTALMPGMQKDGWWSRVYESLLVSTGDRAAAVGYKLQHSGELVAAKKTAAVVASTAALAGGAAVQEGASDRRPADRRTETAAQNSPPAREPVSAPTPSYEPQAQAPAPLPAGSGSPPEPTESEVEHSAAAEFSPEGASRTPAPTPAGPPPSAGEGSPAARNSAEAPGSATPSRAGADQSRGAQEFAP
jgi:DNA-directed RNA polymerase specialized sigma24 family protein